MYSHVAPYLPGTLADQPPCIRPADAESLASSSGRRWRPPPTAVSDRSPAGTGEKRAALEALVDHIVPGRSVDTRGPSEDELRITRIVRLPIDEASAKLGALRRPNGEPENLKLPFWDGVIPLRIVAGVPIATEGARRT